MKKSLIVLAILFGLTHCKQKEKEVSQTENGQEIVQDSANSEEIDESVENVVIDENGEAIVFEENSALHKKEDDSYVFRYNLKKGETYPFLMSISTDQTMSMDGQSIKLSSTRTVGFDYFVEEVKGNKIKLKSTFVRYGESFKDPMGETLSYDTSKSKPSDERVAPSWMIYKAITGQSFQMEIDNKGKVLNISGMDAVVNNAMAKIKNDFPAEDQKDIREMLQDAMSNEVMKIQFEEAVNIFPDKSMKIGEEWEEKQNINEGPIKGSTRVVRTFKGIENGVATISVSGTQEVSGTDTQKESGISAKMKNTGSVSGSVDLDLETGWLKKVKITKKENIDNVYTKGDMKQTESGSQTIVTTVN